jgi:hypothetical protein
MTRPIRGRERHERPARGDGSSLRPCLIPAVLRHKTTGEVAVKIACGTKTLKTWLRADRDIIIRNTSDLDAMGLAVATRFVLDEDPLITFPWRPPCFGCWSGRKSPRLGTLLLEYQKEFAWITMRRMSGE